jgi:GNAT superfamily N-acetyltransferase
MTSVRYREGTRGDAEAIAALHAESWRTTYRGAMRDAYLDGDIPAERRGLWRTRLATPAPNQHVIVAERDGRLVGFACAYGGADPRWGTELDNLHAGEKDRGIGAGLLARVARWARATHPEGGLYLQVLDQNAGARRFYDRNGGRDDGADVWHAPDGSTIPVRRYVWPPRAADRLAAWTDVAIGVASTAEDYGAARALFEEYAAELDVDLCFQGFAAEVQDLPAMYGGPHGTLLLARRAGVPVACVGVRRVDDETAEMKRLYVRGDARGLGLGERLAADAVATARRLGYRAMVLDTLERMDAARAVYARLGFTETGPYYANPLPGVRYMRRALA